MEDFLTRVTQYHLICVPLLVFLEFTINSYASLKRSLDPQIRMNFLSFSKPGLISRPILEIIWRFFLSKKLPQKIYHNIFFSLQKIHKKYTEGKLLDRKWPPHFGNARNLFGLKMTLNTTHPFGKSPKKILRICGSKLPLLINTDIEGILSKIKCYALSPAPPDSGFEMLIIHLKQGHLWLKYSVGSRFWCRERKL